MNDNVIPFPDKNNEKTERILKIQGAEDKPQYLRLCKKYLIKDDYEEVLCGILDEEYYNKQTDIQLKDIIDVYHKY